MITSLSARHRNFIPFAVVLALVLGLGAGYGKRYFSAFAGAAGETSTSRTTDPTISLANPPTPVAQSASGLEIPEHVIGGGGGSSSGGNLQLSGTIGQPAAGTELRNGQFSIVGGFWPQESATSPTASPVTLSGRVLDTTGRPVGGATIEIVGGPTIRRAITDGNGYYRLDSLETGDFYTATPARANYSFSPANRSFSLLADKTDAMFTAQPVGPNANPLDSPEFFVRQQYLDFLGREPEQGGLDYWSAQMRACNSDVACIHSQSVAVSAAFFIEREFQQTGSFVYRMYKASLGRQPTYLEFSADRGQLVGVEPLEQLQQTFADGWVTRDVFRELYPDTISATDFVNRLFDTAGLQPFADERQREIEALASGRTRADVLREVIEIAAFKAREYNPSFVLMQYFGYLRRDPDQQGYDFWLAALNNDPTNYRGMVCAFITATEYQQRFSSVVTRSNAECRQVSSQFTN